MQFSKIILFSHVFLKLFHFLKGYQRPSDKIIIFLSRKTVKRNKQETLRAFEMSMRLFFVTLIFSLNQSFYFGLPESILLFIFTFLASLNVNQ